MQELQRNVTAVKTRTFFLFYLTLILTDLLTSDRNYSYRKMTYLHYAAFSKSLVAAQILLRKGANPYLRTFSGRGLFFYNNFSDEEDDDIITGTKASKKKPNDGNGKNAIEMFPDMEPIVQLWFNKNLKLGQLMMAEVSIAKFGNVQVRTAK